ncbi:unnamed protein product [Mycena citricolor]|uniref:Protein kinase domain-containing protein n=1 Tax=Mycena citricolor TaxID=2018698 RepID=A0AAD2H8M6_9AGAR|nr:unnamed protein product [Mycena citricolor]
MSLLALPNLVNTEIDDGRFELIKLLGAGTHGMVYKAIDHSASPDRCTSPPRLVAVKCMRRSPAGSRSEASVVNELRTHHAVRSGRHITGFFRSFRTAQHVFAVVELSACDLFEAMIERKVFRGQLGRAKRAMSEILDGVEYLHDRGVFHRDLKPENILCDLDGSNIRVCDFGLATTDVVSNEFGFGTHFYMSPEILDPDLACGTYSPRSNDLWACSILLLVLVTGKLPWGAAHSDDRHFARFSGDPDGYLRTKLRLVDPATALFRACFERDPELRPTLHEFRLHVQQIDVFVVDAVAAFSAPAAVPVVPPKAPSDSDSSSCSDDSSSLLASASSATTQSSVDSTAPTTPPKLQMVSVAAHARPTLPTVKGYLIWLADKRRDAQSCASAVPQYL